MRYLPAFFFVIIVWCGCSRQHEGDEITPNFLILMSDNQYVDHLGAYGDPFVNTPNIDQLAKEGILFKNAFCGAPSCAPARAAMITGQDIWRLEEAANLWGGFPQVEVYPQIMQESGYHVGIEGKGWGPGDAGPNGWKDNPGGPRYDSFEAFFKELEEGQPWMYWYSSRDPHRPFREDGWKNLAVEPDKIEVPPYLPDTEDVRKDIADYYNEVQLFDDDVASYIDLAEERGQLENTVIIVCSDNGWQMPRGLANLYDFGTKIPLIISWPRHFPGNRKVDDFVSLNDFAPTILELAGLEIPKGVTAKSMVDILESEANGQIDDSRSFVVMGRERHAFVRKEGLGYPGRALRNNQYLLIKNYEYDRWPAGDPPLFGDVDAHMLHYPSPTKIFMLENREQSEIKDLFELAFAKRPMFELFDLEKDPYQLNNVAESEAYREVFQRLSVQLTDHLIATKDPRETGQDYDFDAGIYFKDRDKHPKPSEEAKKRLNLKDEYRYLE